MPTDIKVIMLIVLVSFWMFTSKRPYVQGGGLLMAILSGLWVIVKYGQKIGL